VRERKSEPLPVQLRESNHGYLGIFAGSCRVHESDGKRGFCSQESVDSQPAAASDAIFPDVDPPIGVDKRRSQKRTTPARLAEPIQQCRIASVESGRGLLSGTKEFGEERVGFQYAAIAILAGILQQAQFTQQ